MGLSIQVRTAVATSLLVLSAQVNSVSASPTSTSTVSLMRSSPASSSAIPGVTNSNTPIVLAVVPVRDSISRRDTEHKHPKHYDSDKGHHDFDKEHHHSDKKHHHSDKEHHDSDKKHHDSDKGHHDSDKKDHHHDKGHSDKKHHHDKGFVGTAPANPLSCAEATTFDLTDGLISSGGEYLAKAGDVLYEPFTTSSKHGVSAAGKFGVEDGYLRWYDDGFYGGRARYCQMPGSGQVYVTYHIDSTWPAGCKEVDLAVKPQSWCQDGYKYKHDDGDKYKTKTKDDDHYDTDYPTSYTTSSEYPVHTDYETSSYYVTPTSYEAHSSYKTPTSRATPTYPTGSVQTPTSEGIYPTYASPTGQICVETPLSWVLGSHTFIRDEL
ncbi:hypothetical protein GL218_02432 [Daldinia childiae]|uniref:uncharacterized protein n=1 Tax=Daldinia childiae TaxID=326645 RepID=UPI001446EACE|nr:uncharacterized protein GL218_02432 [Daldinia childiae]KAF3064480.1 hypothetical protein GL218_02432 [Daldinia childiae]